MADNGESRAQVEYEIETPSDFLGKLVKALREKEDSDVGLADILATHMLTATPSVDAIEKAKVAILKLASDRANPPKPEPARG